MTLGGVKGGDPTEKQQKPVESTTNDANHIDAKKEEVQQVMKEVKKKEEDLAKKEEKADKILKELEKQKHEQEKILNAQKQVRTRSQYFVLRTFYTHFIWSVILELSSF